MTITEALTPVMARAIERLYYRHPLMTRDPETAPETAYGSRIEPEYDADDVCGPTDEDREAYMRDSLSWPALDDLLDEEVA